MFAPSQSRLTRATRRAAQHGRRRHYCSRADLGVRLLDYRTAWSGDTNRGARRPAAPAAPRYRIDDIVAAHLFGQETVAGSAKALAPETRLNLCYRGCWPIPIRDIRAPSSR